MAEFKTLKIEEIIQPEYNPRIMKESDLGVLEKSIRDYGITEPLVVNVFNMHCVGGNQRLEAMKRMGIKEVVCSCVVIEDEKKEKELNLALNKINGEWDEQKLADLLGEDDVLEFETGFSSEEINKYLNVDDFPEKNIDSDEYKDLYVENVEEEGREKKQKHIIVIIGNTKARMPYETYTNMIESIMEKGLFGKDIQHELKRRLLS